jgi:TPR repeat protein
MPVAGVPKTQVPRKTQIESTTPLHRAYERGDPRAALELGETYDPLLLKRLNVRVLNINFYAHAAQARDWYRKAAELGSADAVQRIMELTLSNR